MTESLQVWREKLRAIRGNLASQFQSKPHSGSLLRAHTRQMDALLKQLWKAAEIDAQVALIAVGGYGRSELFPYSDIDVLILTPEGTASQTNEDISALISLFWDIGLQVGHSVRTPQECLNEASQDVTTLTNLLESRFLIGNKSLFLQTDQEIRDQLDAINFLELKQQEQKKRHAKFNDTAYNLEPNIKESPGGLRDLHMILWLAQSQGLGNTWTTLAQHGIITMGEKRQIQRHQANLEQLRIRLHLMAKRREDRLLFDYQNDLAAQLDLTNNKHCRASEQLMRRFYTSAKFINFINELLVKLLAERVANAQQITPINAVFMARNGWLELQQATDATQQIATQPGLILEAFLTLQQHPELKGMGATLLRGIYNSKHLINATFRKTAHYKRLFLDMFMQAEGIHHSLRRMNRYGILGRYIPAFGKIIGQMQHDLFHVYTVDEHTLKVLGNLRRYAKPELSHELPLCSELFAEFSDPHLLYLAALFHDIAKGRGGDHSTLGEIDARQFCRAHRLPSEDAEYVAWLVKSHLVMSSTAQKEDLSDPGVIEKFCHLVGDERRLTGLYLLTVADIRGTSPAIWNTWKAKLLESLYHTSKRALTNGIVDITQEIDSRKTQARHKLEIYNLKAESYLPLWETFGEQYFLRYESDEIAWHSRLLTPHLHTQKPIIRARLSPSGDGIQAMIYMPDKQDVFAHICHFFDGMRYNILQAKIYTTPHHYVLDTFIIEDQSGKAVSYNGLLKHIETGLTEVLASNAPPAEPISGRISRQVKHMPITTKIGLSNASAKNQHLLEITTNDRPGLLDTIAQQFLLRSIKLHNAKINTLGNRVEDHFLISAQQDQTLSETQLAELKQAIEAVLQ